VIPYDPSHTSLFTPGRADDFFTAGGFTGNDAATCAEMARLAYVEEVGRLESYLRRGGFRLLGNYDQGGTQAFVAESGAGDVVLAFRGTQGKDPRDVIADGRLVPTTWTTPAGDTQVHEGFARALLPHWPGIETLLPVHPHRLMFTGHSLGAALATLAASLRRPDYLATFGSPLVGHADFVQSLGDLLHHRFVGCCDGVTLVPPPALGYVHGGALFYIDRHGAVRGSPSEGEIEDDRRHARLAYVPIAFHLEALKLRELADHAPINYLRALLR
jgi:hypothetical protein